MRLPMQKLTTTALLIALGIVIPMVSPVRFVFPPVSYTLGSHVPIFIAMFISPFAALALALGTTLGFFLGGFPLIIVLRAASHVVFALAGAMFLQRHPQTLATAAHSQVFSLGLGLVHTLGEVLVVAVFFASGAAAPAFYQLGFWLGVVLLIGLGGLLHSMLDFIIALLIVRPLARQKSLGAMFACLNQGAKAEGNKSVI